MITFMYPTIINIPPSHNTELKTGRQKNCGPAGNITDMLLVFTWLATNSIGFDAQRREVLFRSQFLDVLIKFTPPDWSTTCFFTFPSLRFSPSLIKAFYQ